MSWTDRVADRSPTVQRSRDRSVAQAQVIVDAARRLIGEKGTNFTINELVREAGVALQTFYRYFEGKDQLQLAVFEDLLEDGTSAMKVAADRLTDPVERLHLYVTSGFTGVDIETEYSSPRFITAEHWRLYQEFPAEMASATRRFTDLVLAEIGAAIEAGSVTSDDPERDAWMMTNLVMAMFHQSAFAPSPGAETGEQVWAFCRAALGVAAPKRATTKRRSGTRRKAG